MRKEICLFWILLFSAFTFQQARGQTLSFTVHTVTAGGTYSPRHVLAIWIEDGSGKFVKTLKKNAVARVQYLYTWNTKSSGNVTDALTGATLTSHTIHNVTWNCTDVNQNSVAPGNYKLKVEFTDQHAQGPLYSVDFTVGSAAQQTTLSDQTYFKDMSLTYTPLSTGIDETTLFSSPLVTPNPGSGKFRISLPVELDLESQVNIYDMSGRLVYSEMVTRSGAIDADISQHPAGIYIMEIKNSQKRFTTKLTVK